MIYVLIIAGLVAIRITRLILSRRSRTSGSRLHTRLTKVFTLIALLPTIIVAIFATISINFGLEGWFSSNVQKVVENSMMAAKAYENEQKQYLVNDLNYLANVLNNEISKNRLIEEGYIRNVLSKFQPNSISESFIIDFTGDIRLRGERSYLFDFEKISNADIDKAISGEIVIIKDWPTNEFRAIKKLSEYNNRLLYVSRIVDGNILQLLDETQDTVLLYQQIENERYGLLFKFGLLYIAFSLVMILIAVWMALWFAEKLSKPVGRLAEAAKKVGSGDFDIKVMEENTKDEIAFLSKVFNRMTNRLKNQRNKLLENNKTVEHQREFLEAIVSGVNGGIISINKEEKIEIINNAAKLILKLKKDKNFVNQKISKVIKEFNPIIKKVKKLDLDFMSEELIINKNKRSLHILLRISKRYIGGKVYKGFILTFDDITDLIYAQRNAAWVDVARRIAHEIKNPLTPIKLSAEQLKKKVFSKSNISEFNIIEYSEMIIRQTEVLQRIVDEFSEFARMPEPRKKMVNINDLVKSSVLLQKAVYDDIQFNLHLNNLNSNIFGDSAMLSQALTNLLKNSAESINSSKRKIINKEKVIGIIDIFTNLNNNFLEIKIIDTGIGLDNKITNFFEPYVTTKQNGTGLGLAIVRKIIEQHNGSLNIYNSSNVLHRTFNKGAIAMIKLPLMLNKNKFKNDNSSESDFQIKEKIRTL
ncbi:MAG: PAS domain-containing sensor histidine kinase [Rhodobacterales bacterium]|nr:MAG: PAS domain-containing sensor histidine kinase [Rhodobacterales bacterium]